MGTSVSDEVQELKEGPKQPSERMVVHYYLVDDKHSMDALIRNKAEAELLGLIRHLLVELNLEVSVESTIREEGGLIETWVLIADNPALLVTAAIGASSLLTNLITIFKLIRSTGPGLDYQCLARSVSQC